LRKWEIDVTDASDNDRLRWDDAIDRLPADAPESAHRLAADRARLRGLPRAKAPARIAANVARAIGPVTVRSARRTPSWLPYALAASVLVAVVGVSYWLTKTNGRRDGIVKTNPPAVVPRPNDEVTPTPQTAVARAPEREQLPLPGMRPSAAVAQVTPPPAVPDEPKWLGAGLTAELPTFENVTVRVPFVFAPADLGNDDVRSRLAAELSGIPAGRLDLFAKDLPKAVDQITNAMKSQGVTVTTVSITAEQLKRKLPVHVAVYCESLSKDDWLAVLKKLTASDAFGPAHLLTAGSAESRELKGLLGVDPGLNKRPRDDGSEIDTLQQVVQAIHKTKPAIVTTMGPGPARVNPVIAKEIKPFLQSRGERLANALPMLIVLRGGG
jgi:hypothetical protein